MLQEEVLHFKGKIRPPGEFSGYTSAACRLRVDNYGLKVWRTIEVSDRYKPTSAIYFSFLMTAGLTRNINRQAPTPQTTAIVACIIPAISPTVYRHAIKKSQRQKRDAGKNASETKTQE